MADINLELVTRLTTNVEKLTVRYASLKQQVSELESEKAELRKKLDDANKAYVELDEKFNIYRMSRNFVGDGDEASDTKKRIDKIVREIDKCIALLNR